jgi:hypothetical protein
MFFLIAALRCAGLLLMFFLGHFDMKAGGALGALTVGLIASNAWEKGFPRFASLGPSYEYSPASEYSCRDVSRKRALLVGMPHLKVVGAGARFGVARRAGCKASAGAPGACVGAASKLLWCGAALGGLERCRCRCIAPGVTAPRLGTHPIAPLLVGGVQPGFERLG